MKKVLIVTLLFLFFVIPISLNAYTCDGVNDPLCNPATKEFKYSEHFLLLEQIQKDYLYVYVRLVKARYLLRKKIPWISKNILHAIDLQARIIHLRNDYEN